MSELRKKVSDLIEDTPYLDFNAIIERLEFFELEAPSMKVEAVRKMTALLKLKIGLATCRSEDTRPHQEDYDRLIRLLPRDLREEIRGLGLSDLKDFQEDELEWLRDELQPGGELVGEPLNFFPRVPDLGSGKILKSTSSARIRYSKSNDVWGKKVTKEIINETSATRRRARQLRDYLRKIRAEGPASRG